MAQTQELHIFFSFSFWVQRYEDLQEYEIPIVRYFAKNEPSCYGKSEKNHYLCSGQTE